MKIAVRTGRAVSTGSDAQWTARSIKSLGRVKAGAGFPIDLQGLTGEELPFFKVGSLGPAGRDGYVRETDDWISRPTAKALRAHVFSADSVVLAKIGAALMLGRIRMLAQPGCLDNNMLGIEASDHYDSRFIFYSLHLIDFELIANPGAVPSLNERAFRDTKLLVPDKAHQRQIAKFLDRETDQIDELIGKQNALIELLGERLDRAWSAAVERLLLEYPVVPFRHAISSIVDGPFGSSLASAHYSDEGSGVVRLGNIGINEFKLVDRAFISLEYAATLSAHAVRPGDVVVAGLGDEKMPLGRAAVVPVDFGVGIVKADCYRVRPAAGIKPEYLSWILSAPQSRAQFKAIGRGSTRQRLNTRVVQELRMPLPSPQAQEAAVGEFRAVREAHGELIRKATQVVEVLHERRSALITAAVTGKIDVRGAA